MGMPLTITDVQATATTTPPESVTDRLAGRLLIDQVLLLVEAGTQAGESLLQTEGKGIFRRAVESQPHATPDAVADRLYDAITGYNYRAWRRRRNPSPRQFQLFGKCVLEGLEQGVGETSRLLVLMQARLPTGAEPHLRRSVALVQTRLGDWFRRERDTLSGGASLGE
jgi:hypothetical protein